MREFAQKIAAALGTASSVSLTMRNLAGLDATEAGSIESALRLELARRGLRVAPSTEPAMVVTLSKSAQGYLWVAEIHGPNGTETVITPVSSLPARDSSLKPVPQLHKTVLFQQTQLMLDFLEIVQPDGTQLLWLLEPDRLALWQRDGPRWALEQAAPVRHANPWSRDVRGLLVASGDGGPKVFLPGMTCTASRAPALSLDCGANVRGWPDEKGEESPFTPDRNYFEAAALGISPSLSYSIAPTSLDGARNWILTRPDSTAELFENGAGVLTVFSGWGDEVASVATGCGSERHLLVSGTGDWTQPDLLETYQMEGTNAVPVSKPLDFSGPILALWTQHEGESARVVSRNLQTGMYEASIISISCGD